MDQLFHFGQVKLRCLLDATVVVLKQMNEWPVVESYGRPIRFPICGRCTQKLERGREMQMSQSQRGHAELSLSQNYKEAENESKGKPVGGRKVSDQKS